MLEKEKPVKSICDTFSYSHDLFFKLYSSQQDGLENSINYVDNPIRSLVVNINYGGDCQRTTHRHLKIIKSYLNFFKQVRGVRFKWLYILDVIHQGTDGAAFICITVQV